MYTKFTSFRPAIRTATKLTRLRAFQNGPQNRTRARFPITAGSAFLATACVLVISAGFLTLKSRSTEHDGSTTPLAIMPPPQHNTHDASMKAAIQEFSEIVGSENISLRTDDLATHSTSDWSSHQSDPDHVPFCVVLPSSTQNVSAIMKVCHRRRIPITPYSGGTSLEGHFTPTRGGISLDFRRMDRVLELHESDMDVVVQPAVPWQELNEQLAKDGLFFPPDPGPGAMIGGMIGTGCSGTNAFRYGTMRDWVLSLTVVLADGTVIKTRRRARKSSAGYDLTRLFVGSEGTLGLVTEATLKLTTLPEKTSVAVCSFPTVRQAADCAASVFRSGHMVAAMEILDEEQMRCINSAGMTNREWEPLPTLFFKFAGSERQVQEQIGVVQKMARQAGSADFEFAKNTEEQEELWSARKEALWSTLSVSESGDRVWTGDVAVPVSRLSEIITQTQLDLKSTGLTGTIVGHVGDGNFHTLLLYNESQRAIAESFTHRMIDRALSMDGTVTGEHGIGLGKRSALVEELGQDTIDAMRRLKLAYDPLCLLNCDKIIHMR